jgi:hypothetical protein
MLPLSPRQIHLDFHTSEHIPDVAVSFDAQTFAQVMKDAHVSSVTVFARCHHGWLYYPSKAFPERIHPTLINRNLLLEQVRALHEKDIRAPIYITVQWDYYSASRHPEWLIRKADGAHEGEPFTEAGFYQSLCVNTGYEGFLREQTAEICALLGEELDGIFFDIVGIRPCLCAACREKMRAEGVNMQDDFAVRAFTKRSIDRFKKDMTALVRSFSKDCTIFYNAGHIGPCTRASADTYSHFELESLPSGLWGYLHFPVTARYARTLEKDCVGMTGKFHTVWGDFHSLKNQAALEFECFRMLSYGFACSIGDQLEPCGELGRAAYRLISQVYGEMERREEYARPSRPLVEAALLTSENCFYVHQIPDSIMGAVQMLEEIGLQFDIIDPESDLNRYPLLILPEDFISDQVFLKKLEAYIAEGGRVISVGAGGADTNGVLPSCFGTIHQGKIAKSPDFILGDASLCSGLESDMEYAMYLPGENIHPTNEAQTLLWARAPYFERNGDHFCSHRYTPSAHKEPYPAAVKGENTLVFSHPLFLQYRQNAPRWCKILMQNALNQMLPAPRLIRHNGPSTMTVSLLDQPEKGRVCAHILTYVPVRKSATIDIIEERTKLTNVELEFNLPHGIASALLVPEGTPLVISNGRVIVPEIDGYAIIELTYEDAKEVK